MAISTIILTLFFGMYVGVKVERLSKKFFEDKLK